MLVNLSGLQIERASVLDGSDARGDLGAAEENLARALVIDPNSAAATNQLALLHLAKAKWVAGGKGQDGARCAETRRSIAHPGLESGAAGRQELEAAMGICLRGVREHPTYPP